MGTNGAGSYGDIAFNDFIHTVLAVGDRLFAAHMVIMTSRASIKLGTMHATSMSVIPLSSRTIVVS